MRFIPPIQRDGRSQACRAEKNGAKSLLDTLRDEMEVLGADGFWKLDVCAPVGVKETLTDAKETDVPIWQRTSTKHATTMTTNNKRMNTATK